MNSFTKLFTIEKINARRATRGFFHALWHLRSLIGMLLIVFFALSVLMFYFGAPVDSSTHVPSSFGETLYFCGVTALTIGYGDVVATTGIGRILSVVLGLHGVLVTGLTTAAAVFAVQRTVGDAH